MTGQHSTALLPSAVILWVQFPLCVSFMLTTTVFGVETLMPPWSFYTQVSMNHLRPNEHDRYTHIHIYIQVSTDMDAVSATPWVTSLSSCVRGFLFLETSRHNTEVIMNICISICSFPTHIKTTKMCFICINHNLILL